jgi:hypothetical protein
MNKNLIALLLLLCISVFTIIFLLIGLFKIKNLSDILLLDCKDLLILIIAAFVPIYISCNINNK